MNTPNPTETRSLLRRLFRFGFPQMVLIIGSIVYAIMANWPGTDLQGWYFAMAKASTVMLMVLLIFLWSLFFSGFRKSRVIIMSSILGLGFMLLFGFTMDGDMSPKLHLKESVLRLLGISHDDDLMRDRKAMQANKKTVPLDFTEKPSDWPAYRGKAREGVVSGFPLNTDWQNHPPKQLWKHLIGRGYAAFSVVGHQLITIEQRYLDGKEYEVVVCYDSETGNEIWDQRWEAKFDETAGGVGPRSTPTIDQGKVYALGALGHFVCLNATNGEVLWSKELLEGNQNLRWGMSASPLIYENLVVVAPGAQTPDQNGKAIRAFDKVTGNLVWESGKHPAAYSSPMIAKLNGISQLLFLDSEKIGAFAPETGKPLWSFPWKTQQGINVAQPLVIEKDQVFISAGYSMGGLLLKITQEGEVYKPTEVWKTKTSVMRCKFASPVYYQGYIYGLNDGIMECINATDGKVSWKDDRRSGRGEAYGHGQILLVNDHILILTESGEVVLIEANPKELKELGRFAALEGRKTWNNPAIANGILYIRNHLEMAAFDLSKSRQ